MRPPRYKRVVDTFADEIRSGRLVSGTRLPTHRDLAAREQIALATASRVYAELAVMGLVSGEQGRGTFVRDIALPPGHGIDQQAVAADTVDLNFNYPSVPGQAGLLRDALRTLASAGDLDALLHYQPHRGRSQDRAAVARHLLGRGLAVSADQVLIVNGAQHGLAVTAMATLRAGDVIAVDDLTYPGFKVLAHTLGLELAPVPTTAAGPDLDALEQLCATRTVRSIYTMPTLHNPLGGVMSLRRRRRLVAIARRHDLLVIEDASYAYLVEDAPPPLAELAPEITVHVSGLSKSVATGLRVGFVTAPSAHVASIERAVRATTWNTPALVTAIACRWLNDGTVAALEAAKRHDAATRQAIAREVLHGLPYVSHPSSYFIWLPLPEDARADRIAAALANDHISVSTAEPFATTTSPPQAIRLALVDERGRVVEGNLRTNKAAFSIHSTIHEARPDVVAVAHAHSLHGRAWSALGRLLDPIIQESCAFYGDHVLFDEYKGLVLDREEAERIAVRLGQARAAILRHHGLLTVGRTVEEAVWWFITMDRACQMQLLAEAAGTPRVMTDEEAGLAHRQFGNANMARHGFRQLADLVFEQEPDVLD